MIHYPPFTRRYSSEVSIQEVSKKKGFVKTTKDEETDGELAHSVSLIRKAKENILLWNDGIYKRVRKKTAWNDEPLRNPQGAPYDHVEF